MQIKWGELYDMISYTDDIGFSSPSKAGLQILMDYVSNQLREVRLKLEVAKFCYIVFQEK